MSRPFGYGDWISEWRRDRWNSEGPEFETPPVGGAPPLWEAEFINKGSLNKTGLLLELRLEPERVEERKGRKSGVIGTFLIEALPAGAELKAPLLLGFLKPGRYRLSGARLVGSDVLGLFRLRRKLALDDIPLEVVVGPPILPLAFRREVQRGAGGQEGAQTRTQLGAGGDLRGVRPYVPGDDWRHVHWATTARTGNLAVREFEHTGRSAVMVVWDGASGSSWGEGAHSTLESGLSLCASILVAVDAAQTPLALATLGHTSSWTQGQSENGLLPRAMIESLAEAKAHRDEELSLALLRVARSGGGTFGHVFFVSSSLRLDLVEAVRACAVRGEAVTVALLDGSAWLQAGRPPKNAPVQHDGGRAVAVTGASYDAQQRALENVGARVVRVAPEPGDEASGRATLEKALLEVLNSK